MAREKNHTEDFNRHDRARELGEEALADIAAGNEARADEEIAEAKQLDETALEELVQDLDEEAADRAKR